MQTKINVKWRLSDEARKIALIETGEMPEISHHYEIELGDLTPEQREPLVELMYPTRNWFDASRVLKFDPDARFGKNYIESETQMYDQKPGIDQIVDVARHSLAAERRADEYRAQLKAQEQAEQARKRELYQTYLHIVDKMIAEQDLEGLRGFFQNHVPAREIRGFRPRQGESLNKAVRSGLRDVAADIWEAEMFRWSTEHGSEHLTSCMERGYHCERIYAQERAAAEFPGWNLDFYDEARWKTRTNPSARALKIEQRLEESRGLDVMIVWQTMPAISEPHNDIEEYWDEPFEPCESIRIVDFIGKYDLFRSVASF